MNLEHITYTGPEFDESSKIIKALPDNLVSLLKQINGFVQFGGGLHLRGVCNEPEWHSIENMMNGPLSLHDAYPSIAVTDAPFAEDCVGDQFLLRNRSVIKLYSETGEVEEYGFGLTTFLNNVSENPVEFLGMEPLLQLQNEGGGLEPGELIHVYPPFCTKEAENGVSLKAVPSSEALLYLANFSKKISGLGEGEQFEVKLVE
ncbi:MAG: hypothetical protein N0C81_20725 [Candidatus Thiodiazotropha lotti]|nr:hypothetical protein [Candidatus Thiodiazotropha lotti]MCW4197649.1 hypothetical protein [Candidatus Thiodiazotropha lotti]